VPLQRFELKTGRSLPILTNLMSLWKKLLWIAVTLLGVASIYVLALSRGEPISALWIIVAGLCAFAISYRFYSKWLATKVLVLNDERATPAIV
jgi:carbon starvation protein